MLLELNRMQGPHERLSRTFDAAAVTTADEAYRVVAPVALAFDVYEDKDQYRLAGRVGTTLEVSCARCLDTCTVPIDEAFDVLYLPASANAGEDEVEVGDEDLSVAYYHDDVIDLGGLMRELFYLAVPMKPLCSEDCRGLCPTCGVNRNHATCSCPTTLEDPRVSVLRTLLDDKNSGR